MFYLAKAININLSFIIIAFFVTISGLVTMLPVSISGIGTRDLLMIMFFSFHGLSAESAIMFSTLILFMALIAAFIGFICFMIKPLK